MSIKRIIIAIIGSVIIYGALLWACRATGSGIFSNGPLDWLFHILVKPGFYLGELFDIKSELMIVIVCFLVYVPIFGVIIYWLMSHISSARSAASA